MRTILTAILCSSLLIGGSSTAAEADAAEFQSHRQTPGFYVVVQPGKTDINDLVDRLTKAGCRVKYGPTLNGNVVATTTADCLGYLGEQINFGVGVENRTC